MSNGAFEADTNGDGLPDGWSTNSRFTRSTTVVHGGSFAGKHFATDNSGYTISQTVSNLTAGQAYSISGWVNIPATSDKFTLTIDAQWRTASTSVISTQTIKSYTAATSGWSQATLNMVAPAGTTNVVIRMVVSSLNATIYVDDFVLQRSSLITNGDFEWDANNDGLPDGWTSNAKFTRSAAAVHGGSYAGRHAATDNSGYTISETVSGLTAGKTYAFGAWVNISATGDAFTFTLDIQWRNASNKVLSTSTVKSYSAATGGWTQAAASIVAPTGTTNAVVRMVVTSLNATIYVDDVALN